MKGTKLIAHRGSCELAPENTLSAFEFAIQENADGIELDVHITKDHELVVIHDDYIDRTSNGRGSISNMNLSELKKFDFGSWFSNSFKGEEIPTVEEVLQIFKSKNLKYVFDIKGYHDLDILLEKLIKLTQKYLSIDQYEILSGYDYVLQTVKQISDETFCRRGIFFYPYPLPLWISAELKIASNFDHFDGVNLDLIYSESQISCFERENKKVSAGIFNWSKSRELLKKDRLDLVFTNNIYRFRDGMDIGEENLIQIGE